MEGINSRLDGMQAAILNAKLPHILKWTEARINKADYYTKKINQYCPEVITPAIRPGTKHTFHVYVIRASRRDDLKAYLEMKGIETSIHYPVILPLLPPYSYLKQGAGDFPVAYKCQQEILSLPLYPEITETEVDYVVDTIKTFYDLTASTQLGRKITRI